MKDMNEWKVNSLYYYLGEYGLTHFHSFDYDVFDRSISSKVVYQPVESKWFRRVIRCGWCKKRVPKEIVKLAKFAYMTRKI